MGAVTPKPPAQQPAPEIAAPPAPPPPPQPSPLPNVPAAPRGANENSLTRSQVEEYLTMRGFPNVAAEHGAAAKIIAENGLTDDFTNYQRQIGAISGGALTGTVMQPQTQTIIQMPPGAPQAQDQSVLSARDRERRRRMRLAAKNNTMITGGAGLTTSANTGIKKLYGE